MATLSITSAWNETVAFVTREGRLLFPIAFLLVALPGAILQVVMPTTAPGQQPEAGPWLLVLPLAIVASMVGTLAISFLALRPGASVAEGLQVGLRRFVYLLGAALLIGIAGALLAVPLIIVAGAAAMGGGEAGAAALAALLIIASIPVLLFFWVRLILMTPVAAMEEAGPLRIIARSWQLTRGHFWKLLGFVVLVAVAAIVVMFVVTMIGGLLVFALAGPPDPDSLSFFLLLVLSALLQSVVSALFVTLIARIYAQLTDHGTPQVFA
jgi:hypothetical protein